MPAYMTDEEVVCEHCGEGSYIEDWVPSDGYVSCPWCGAHGGELGEDGDFPDTECGD